MEIPFIKYQATGNDFILIEEGVIKGVDRERLSKTACDRNFGIGSDGLIVLGASSDAETRMYFFNPDGTPDVCGNGIRCVGLHMYKSKGAESVSVETNRSVVNVSTQDGKSFWVASPVVNAPVASKVEVDGRIFQGYTINTGTPHFVTFVDVLTDELVLQYGPRLEHHTDFPEAVSIDFARIDSVGKLSIRIWERSVGETLSCGTGASAAALCANMFRAGASDIEVSCTGGMLTVSCNNGSSFILGGDAKEVFTGRLLFSD